MAKINQKYYSMINQRFRFLWQEPEYSTLDNNLVFHLKDDASEIAKKSYKEYQRYYSKEMEEKRAEFFRKVEEEVDYGDDD